MRILSFCKNTVCGKIDLIKNVDYNKQKAIHDILGVDISTLLRNNEN